MTEHLEAVHTQLVQCGYPSDLADAIVLYLKRCFIPGDPCAFICPYSGIWCAAHVKEVDYDQELLTMLADGWETTSSHLTEAYVFSELVCPVEELHKYNVAEGKTGYMEALRSLDEKKLPPFVGLNYFQKIRMKGIFFLTCSEDKERALAVDEAVMRGECIYPENSAFNRAKYPRQW